MISQDEYEEQLSGLLKKVPGAIEEVIHELDLPDTEEVRESLVDFARHSAALDAMLRRRSQIERAIFDKNRDHGSVNNWLQQIFDQKGDEPPADPPQ